MKTIDKKEFARNLAEEIGINPFINKLIDIEKLATLKRLVLLRVYLFEVFFPTNTILLSMKKEIREEDRFEIIKIITGIENQYRNTSFYIEDTEAFNKVYISMINMSMLFFAQSTGIDKKTKQLVFSETPKLLDVFNHILAATSEDISNANHVKNMMTFLSAPLKKSKPVKEKKVVKKQSKKPETEKASPEIKIDKPVPTSTSSTKTPEKPLKKYLTWKETMKLLRISTSTLRRWEQLGSIPKAIRIGGRIVFDEEELLAHIEKSNLKK